MQILGPEAGISVMNKQMYATVFWGMQLLIHTRDTCSDNEQC